MIFDFCAQSVLKVFNENEQVSDIIVDLDNSCVVLHLKPGTDLGDDKLQDGISYAGYDLVK